jgi:hypothetical protein
MIDLATPHKPVVTSWDVFDTLLARFVPHPHAALHQVVARHAGFLERRLAAQNALDRFGRPYVLRDIYRQMADSGMDQALVRTCMCEELAAERAMLIPIRRNLERVEPTDLIISDMYLSPEQISDFLFDIGGLEMHRPIVRSNWGKHTGTVWPHVLRRYVLRRHVGDNPKSDIEVPARYNITSELVTDAQATPWEQSLDQTGLGRLALIQREVRLRSTPPDAGAFHAAVAGPYLTLLAAYAWHLVHRFGAADYAFLSRSADEAARVFAALHPELAVRQLDLTRRLTRDAHNDGLFAGAVTPSTIVVDMVGTGRSFFRFAERSSVAARGLIFFLFLDMLLGETERVELAARRERGQLYCAFTANTGLPHFRLEHMLQAHYPPVVDLSLDLESGGLVRGFAAGDLSRNESGLIGWKSATVSEFIRTIRRRGIADPGQEATIGAMDRALRAILADEAATTPFVSFLARETQDWG